MMTHDERFQKRWEEFVEANGLPSDAHQAKDVCRLHYFQGLDDGISKAQSISLEAIRGLTSPMPTDSSHQTK